MLHHNTSLPGLPNYAFPVLNDNQTDPYTNPMDTFVWQQQGDPVTSAFRINFETELPKTHKIIDLISVGSHNKFQQE